jgi:branched-chain amino acid transport system permease protein
MNEIAQLLLSGLLRGAVIALVASSFWLIYATTKTFHLAHAVTYSIAGYATVVLANSWHLPLAVAALGALVVAAAAGVAMEVVIYSPLRGKGASTLGIFLASLGLATAGPNLLQLAFGPQGRPVPGFPEKTLSLAGVTMTVLQLTQALVALLVIAGVGLALSRTKLGRAISAVRTNPETAKSVGIPTTRINLIVFASASAMVAIAAFFETANFVAEPNMGLGPVIYGFIGMFIGGISSLRGAAVGGFILGFLLVASGLFLTQNLGVLLVFLVLALVVIWKPEGLLSEATASR